VYKIIGQNVNQLTGIYLCKLHIFG